ncbi:MAG: protein kinase, partial [Myxococcales bacterium]|nr:protein kinase [Myxococcales bacterium]
MPVEQDIWLTQGPEPGRRLGPWRIQARLGAGGHATVWRAVDEAGRQAAIKVLAQHAVREEDRNRFLREQEALAGLDHPHVVRVLGGGAIDGLLWTALEL